MSSSFTPYTYFQCPCTETSLLNTRSNQKPQEDLSSSEDERTFDPRAPRSNFSLYPLEHLLYCEDCHQIRCPRCVLDEIVTWYCPNCLFEVPSSSVKAEGNRCTRSCFQCPICIAPLSVSSVDAPPSGLGAEYAAQNGPFVLHCAYCSWSSKEIGIQVDKPNGIYNQLAKIQNGGKPMLTAKERRKDREDRKRDFSGTSATDREEMPEIEIPKIPRDPNDKLDPESQFSNLKAFYQGQLAEASPVSALGFSDYGYGSPGALSRIMGLYTGSSTTDKKIKARAGAMREAQDALEGLQLTPLSEEEALGKLQTEGWDCTSSASQRAEFPNNNAQFINDLRPIAYLLRTKRSKRCRTCRHILSKPEGKVGVTRFKIRLVAANYIPRISIKPLQPTSSASSQLQPMKPVQFLLTFKNPLFDGVKVTLATPTKTPGRFASKVTVLCPQFEVGANTDAWDEALGREGGNEKRRTKAEASEGQHQAEAGKVWERGRNWVSIVVEVVPASLRFFDAPEFLKSEEEKEREVNDGPVREDEDVCEIPVFVRVEWESDSAHDESGLGGSKEKDVREKRELAYWCVLGVGRIARD